MADPTATWAPLASNLAKSIRTDPEAFSRAAKTSADIAQTGANTAKQQIENEQQAWLNKRTRAATDIFHAVSNEDGSFNDQKASDYMAKNPDMSDLVLGMRGLIQGQAEKAANIARTQVETATGAVKLPAIQARAGYEAQTIQGLPSAFQQASPFQSGFSKLSPADKQAASRFAGASGAAAGGDVGKSLEGMESAKEAQIRAKAQQDFLAGDTGAIQRGEADIQALRSGGFMKEALEGGRQATSTDIAQAGGRLGNVKAGQDIKEKEQILESVSEWKANGFSGVTTQSLEKANDLAGRVNSIWGSVDLAKESLASPDRIQKMSDDEFGELVFNALKGIKTAEGVNTISADESLSSFFRPQKSLGKIVAEGDDSRHIIASLIKNKVSMDDRQKILMDLADMGKHAAKYGIARSELRKYGRGKLPAEKGE